MISLILSEGVEIPKYQSEGASGVDVTANSIIAIYKGNTEITGERLEKIQKSFEERGYINLRGFERVLFGTGLTLADINPEVEIQVRSRSGLALKRGLLVANSPGTVDSDYRSEIGIIILNSTPYLNKVEKGERIAQLVPSLVCREGFGRTTEVIPTKRMTGGFGSTGTK